MTSPDTDSSLVPPRPITPEQRMDALREVNHPVAARLGFIWEWMKIFSVSVLLFLVIRTFIVEAFKIPSGSMEHTLLVGDFLLVNKLIYGAELPGTHHRLPKLREPQRGDVIVFEWPVDPKKNFVKRLVGLPGDTLEMRDGTLFRNGGRVAEDGTAGYLVERTDSLSDPSAQDFGWQNLYVVASARADGPYHPSRNNWGPLVVEAKSYFVLGDNRDNSLDSRYWGFVPDTLVKGKPIVIYYSYAPDTVKRFSWLTRVRWNRVGDLVQ
jgi:signal peptidase I